MTILDCIYCSDEIANIRARSRVLELALMSKGMSLDDRVWRDAILQQAQDITQDLDALSTTLEAVKKEATNDD